MTPVKAAETPTMADAERRWTQRMEAIEYAAELVRAWRRGGATPPTPMVELLTRAVLPHLDADATIYSVANPQRHSSLAEQRRVVAGLVEELGMLEPATSAATRRFLERRRAALEEMLADHLRTDRTLWQRLAATRSASELWALLDESELAEREGARRLRWVWQRPADPTEARALRDSRWSRHALILREEDLPVGSPHPPRCRRCGRPCASPVMRAGSAYCSRACAEAVPGMYLG